MSLVRHHPLSPALVGGTPPSSSLLLSQTRGHPTSAGEEPKWEGHPPQPSSLLVQLRAPPCWPFLVPSRIGEPSRDPRVSPGGQNPRKTLVCHQGLWDWDVYLSPELFWDEGPSWEEC